MSFAIVPPGGTYASDVPMKQDIRLTSCNSTATIFTTEDTEPTENLLESLFPVNSMISVVRTYG